MYIACLHDTIIVRPTSPINASHAYSSSIKIAIEKLNMLSNKFWDRLKQAESSHLSKKYSPSMQRQWANDTHKLLYTRAIEEKIFSHS
ncbi:MAG: hypothetical protein AAF380_00745 [Bacteroidota bacterium]